MNMQGGLKLILLCLFLVYTGFKIGLYHIVVSNWEMVFYVLVRYTKI